jgi:hypothetical protein
MKDITPFLIAGAFGALTKDILQDNRIKLPTIRGNEVILGTLVGMIIGAFVGWAVDHSLITAALSGYVGVAAIKNLLPTNNEQEKNK